MKDKNFIRIENTAKETVGKECQRKKEKAKQKRGQMKEYIISEKVRET
jgi:hypothetical protein